jgi:hypothetical protein
VQGRLRRRLQQGGAGQRVLRRVGALHAQPSRDPRQRHALDEQRAGRDREGDQLQDLPVGRVGRRVGRDDERPARVTTPRMPAQPRMKVFGHGGERASRLQHRGVVADAGPSRRP